MSWIQVSEVKAALGVDPWTDTDDAYLGMATAAANVWAFDQRVAAGYDDDPDEVPSDRVKMGTVLFAVTLYRERGSVDSFQSFDAMPTAMPFGQLAQIRRLLGIGKPRVA